jgi:hypothetical protein
MYVYTISGISLCNCGPAITAHGSLDPINKKNFIFILKNSEQFRLLNNLNNHWLGRSKDRKLRYDMTNFVWNRQFWCSFHSFPMTFFWKARVQNKVWSFLYFPIVFVWPCMNECVHKMCVCVCFFFSRKHQTQNRAMASWRIFTPLNHLQVYCCVFSLQNQEIDWEVGGKGWGRVRVVYNCNYIDTRNTNF